VELFIVAGWTHLHSKKCPFIKGAYRSLYVPGKLLGAIVRKGSPLLVNECLFATGLAVANQCYSTCGLDVVPAMNINNTVWNLVSVAYIAMGNSVGIIMGQMLGAGTDEAGIRDANRKLTALSLLCGVVFGGVAAICSHLFPLLFNTTQEVATLAGWLILISAVMIPFNAYVHAAYFTLRSGGKTGITFLFDCGFTWFMLVPLAYLLSRYTDISILPLYAICQCVEIIKSITGYFMVKSGVWIQNLAK
jgi:Na+-driven multidrug efflux pump